MARKKALGRGLDALISPDPRPVAGIEKVPIDRLQPNRFQPRKDFEPEGLEELAASIAAQGVVQPLVVTPAGDGRYTIVAGERRWRASRKAGLTEVPVVIREVDDDRHLLELALVENLQRADLNVLEEADAYHQLQQRFGLTHEQVASRVGKSRAAVSNTLRLRRLPPEVQDLMRDGRLTAGQARPLLAIEDDAERRRLARRAADGKMTARQLEARAAGRESGPKRQAPPLDADTRAAAERLTRRLQTRVDIQRKQKGGTLRITFHSEEELMRLFELLMERGRQR